LATLFVIPAPIAEHTATYVMPPQLYASVATLKFFAAEDVRTARRYLSSLKIFTDIEALHFSVLNKDTDASLLDEILTPLLRGENMGVLAEAGCPGVADPGALAVGWAHAHDVSVVPLVGPSAILLALMASGLNGQKFAFHGYLPIDAKEAQRKIRDYERESREKNQTQIFIETPYRNNTIFKHLLNCLAADTRLHISLNITGPSPIIKTQAVRHWRQQPIAWPKEPAVFMFLAS
jgi:16S rRNA (cytidine1402-2'-O)-methyltransferase